VDVVYGRNPVAEARRGKRRVHRVFSSEDVDPAELERRAGSPDHQGVVAEVDPYPYADPTRMLAAADALVVALDEVQDPQNLGAICRSAEAAGAGIVICERRAAAITPAVCKASAGAVEHLDVARVRNLADWLAGAREAGGWIYGADGSSPTSFRDVDLSGRAVLVLGAEGKGLRPRVAQACDELISIPTSGRVGSLNVSAAAAVLLFAAPRGSAPGAPS
jgi:23S rRNA (guanosine2251-2'-O)-methyltransferase